jgi:hypothetical protein
VSPFDNALAIGQIEAAYTTLLERPVASQQQGTLSTAHLAKDGQEHPRIISLGGDHTIVCNLTSYRCPVSSHMYRFSLFFDLFIRFTALSQLSTSTLISIRGLVLAILDLALLRQKSPMELSFGQQLVKDSCLTAVFMLVFDASSTCADH